MINIRLPDDSTRCYSAPLTGEALARDISPGLAKKALAIKINDHLMDLNSPLNDGDKVAIITAQDKEGLELLRHDTAHIMAQAIQELFPNTQITIGPVIDHGFYYDIERKEPFRPEDLPKIEARMHEIINRDEKIAREIWERDHAIAWFRDKGELYKAKIIEGIPSKDPISIYKQGDWLDLCRGPHAPSTGKVPKAFKLTKISGSYWRGDAKNAPLQRIYGTAWATQKDLQSHLELLQEAEKRDHRRLGVEMRLFHFQEDAAGSVFWHPRGWRLYRELENYIRRKLQNDYEEIRTPQLVNRGLWEKSGHWEKFSEHMYITGNEENTLAIKPMNCPCHVQVFNKGITSYRQLPMRLSEFGSCHRAEPSGALHGLMRVRAFVQDDAHIFCTPEQINAETTAFCHLLKQVYSELGFEKISVMFADRPEKRVGSDAVWDKAEHALKTATQAANISCGLSPGEGAFYGPKLDFHLTDAIGRSWQCGTLQVDFNLPKRLNASYIDAQGNKQTPVMLHRAILGSMERFLGILIEHTAGHLPLWLAPEQVVVASITSDSADYAKQVADTLKQHNIRARLDVRNEKIAYKVREHTLAKIPVMAAVGQREAEGKTVALRRMLGGKQEVMPLHEAINLLGQQSLPPDA